jgi:hypothetical protein
VFFVFYFVIFVVNFPNSAARARNLSNPPGSITSLPINSEPAPTAQAPAARYSRAASGVTPPVGTTRTSGNGPRKAFTKFRPRLTAGNNFTASAPAPIASAISDGVKHPGNETRPRRLVASITLRSRFGSGFYDSRRYLLLASAEIATHDGDHAPLFNEPQSFLGIHYWLFGHQTGKCETEK